MASGGEILQCTRCNGAEEIGKRLAFLERGDVEEEMGQNVTFFAGELLDEMVSKSEGGMRSTETAYRNQCIVALYESGQLTQQEVAKVFHVSQGLVSQLYARYRVQGNEGIMRKPALGASAKLTAAQREQLGELLGPGSGRAWL